MTGIYKITNRTNNKVYIGQSRDIYARWNRHRIAAYNPNYPQYNCLIYRAIRKYGLNNFEFAVLEQCDEKILNQREQYYIDLFDATNSDKGYNMITSAQYSNNSPITEEIAENIRQLLKNSHLSQMEIATEFATSQKTVSSINLGQAWPSDFYVYPIRPKKRINYCIDCGAEITLRAVRCDTCSRQARSQQHLPPIGRDELKNLIRTTPFTTIGSQFGVSDNAVRKWCDKYDLPRKASVIKQITDADWYNI